MKNFNELTEAIIGAAMEVHRALGPGLLESTYEMCLCRELSIRGIPFERQIPILLEIKAIESLLPIHDAQLLSYLKLGDWKIGLLINFNVELLKNGLRRRVFGLVEEVIL